MGETRTSLVGTHPTHCVPLLACRSTSRASLGRHFCAVIRFSRGQRRTFDTPPTRRFEVNHFIAYSADRHAVDPLGPRICHMEQAHHVEAVGHPRRTVLIFGTCLIIRTVIQTRGVLLTDDEDYRNPSLLVVQEDGEFGRGTTLIHHLLHLPCLGVDLDATTPIE